MDSVIDVPKKSFLPATVIYMGLIWIGLTIIPEAKEIKCISSSKIIDILSVEDSDITIKLENGKIISVNNKKLKKGDMYCILYSKNN